MGRRGFTSRQVQDPDCPRVRSRVTPIHMTAAFPFEQYEDAQAQFRDGLGYGYTRIANPTTEAVESTLADLEGGSGALLLASGQAATAVALLSLLSAGDHLVLSAHIYEGTRGLVLDNLSRWGIDATFVSDIGNPDAWEAAIGPRTRAVFAETVSNAQNRVLDIPLVAGIAHRHGLPLVVDNTFPTPYLLRPIEHGADVVVHSASKFLAGHGSAIGGVIVDAGTFDPASVLFPHLTAPGRTGTASFADRAGGNARLAYARECTAPRLGPTPSPFNAFLIAQGVETLSLRVQRQSANALAVATWLEARDEVDSVDYVGLPTHPDHALAQRLLSGGFGAVFTFTVRGGVAQARAVIEHLRTITHMTHVGDVRSLVLHPASTSHVFATDAERAELGVYDGTLRLSIGIEDIDDLTDDLATALEAAFARESVGGSRLH